MWLIYPFPGIIYNLFTDLSHCSWRTRPHNMRDCVCTIPQTELHRTEVIQQPNAFYLNAKIYVIPLRMQASANLVFLRGIIQLAFVFSTLQRSKINGHAVGLHKTQHSAAPLIRHLFLLDHVAPHFFVWYRFFKYNHAAFIICKGRKRNFKLRDMIIIIKLMCQFWLILD